jgi:hypothetical protein
VSTGESNTSEPSMRCRERRDVIKITLPYLV